MLTLNHDTKEIDGIVITTTQFPAMRAFRLLTRLLKVAGPALGALSKLDAEHLDMAGEQLGTAFAELDDKEATALLPEILNATTAIVDGREYPLLKTENIDLVFSGRLQALFKTLAFALQVNYKGFSIGDAPAAPTTSA